MIADVWASFLADLVAKAIIVGWLTAGLVLIGAGIWSHGRRHGRLEQARHAVDRRWRQARQEVLLASAETQPVTQVEVAETIALTPMTPIVLPKQRSVVER